jgi:hypothetical protein
MGYDCLAAKNDSLANNPSKDATVDDDIAGAQGLRVIQRKSYGYPSISLKKALMRPNDKGLR